MNGKKHLTQYYVGKVCDLWAKFKDILRDLGDSIFCLTECIYCDWNDYYMAAIAFFIPSSISQIPNPYLGLSDQLQTGSQLSWFFGKIILL